jgi:hypothetical protein
MGSKRRKILGSFMVKLLGADDQLARAAESG